MIRTVFCDVFCLRPSDLLVFLLSEFAACSCTVYSMSVGLWVWLEPYTKDHRDGPPSCPHTTHHTASVRPAQRRRQSRAARSVPSRACVLQRKQRPLECGAPEQRLSVRRRHAQRGRPPPVRPPPAGWSRPVGTARTAPSLSTVGSRDGYSDRPTDRVVSGGKNIGASRALHILLNYWWS